MKSIIIKILIVIGVIAVIAFQRYQITKIKNERDRFEYNFQNASFKIDSITGKNGELITRVNSLVLTKNELEQQNKNLYSDVESMGLKIKQLQSIGSEKHEYIVNYDTIYLERVDTSGASDLFKIEKKDEWVDMMATLQVDPYPLITNFHLKITNDITTATEFIFKRRWFLGRRRVVGANVYTRSDNPYFHLNKKETYMVKNKWNDKLNN